MKKAVFACLVGLLLLGAALPAFSSDPVAPSKKDKCPVCGMFVYKYPDWVAAVHFEDGQVNYFDGVKDMFKFLFDMARYAPGKTREDITDIFVTEYYSLELMPAEDAWYVSDSDVYGPMGKELIPFDSLESAETFMIDHKGREVLAFEEIDARVIEDLD